MTKEEQIKEMANLMAETMLKNYGLRYKDFAEVLYNAGYRKIDVTNNVSDDAIDVSNNVLDDAIDATFRGAVLRLAEKLKQRSYCDNCFVSNCPITSTQYFGTTKCYSSVYEYAKESDK